MPSARRYRPALPPGADPASAARGSATSSELPRGVTVRAAPDLASAGSAWPVAAPGQRRQQQHCAEGHAGAADPQQRPGIRAGLGEFVG